MLPGVEAHGFSRLRELAAALAREAASAYQRRTLVLSGTREWCRAAAVTALEATELADALWITDQPQAPYPALEAAKAHKVLGQELDALVLDAHAGFDPDAFGAAVGTVRGGGLLLLLTPPFDRWPQLSDPQNSRIGA